MNLSPQDFEFQLPPALIATHPAFPRDSSRLLVVNRQTGSTQPSHFNQLLHWLQPGDVLVRNNTQVIPARLIGHKTTGGQVEILLSQQKAQDATSVSWECLTRPGLKLGQRVVFGPSTGENHQVVMESVCTQIDELTRIIQFNKDQQNFWKALDLLGRTPLPPYILKQLDDTLRNTSEAEWRQQYQTTYAEVAGSVAAPTAGLHFTPELDAQLLAADHPIVPLTLHVGLGTFLPVTSQQVAQRRLHTEQIELSASTADQLNSYRQQGRRLIAVGTTTCRVLESCFNTATGQLQPKAGITDLFIMPPYQFQAVDGMITNFHLPHSSLLMLVSALVSAPNTATPFENFEKSLIGQAYQVAISQKFRFYSFGDAMFIS